jgi:predicted small lipoprotein YifL
MAKTLKILFLVLSLTALAACGQKEEEKPKAAAPTALALPADSNDDQAWKMYLSSVVKTQMQGIRNSPYMYYLPAAAGPESEEYIRQVDNVVGVVGRGVLPGNMLAFGSPQSAAMADLVIEAFTDVSAGSMKDVRVLFIGAAADSERVKTAVEASGATYVFHEAK